MCAAVPYNEVTEWNQLYLVVKTFPISTIIPGLLEEYTGCVKLETVESEFSVPSIWTENFLLCLKNLAFHFT